MDNTKRPAWAFSIVGKLQYLVNLGTHAGMTSWQLQRVKLLNKALLLSTAVTIFLGVYHSIQQSRYPLHFIVVFFSVNIILLYLNHRRKWMLAKILACSIYPLIIFADIVVVGHDFRGEYPLFVIFLISVFLFRERWVQWLAGLYIFALYLASQTLKTKFEHLLGEVRSSLDNHVLFAVTMGCLILIVNAFLKEIMTTQQHTEELLDDLVEVNADLKHFGHMVSHDLRSPLRSVLSFSELAEKAIHKQQYQQAAEFLGYVQEGGRQMNKLTEELLSLSGLDSREVDMGEQCVADLFERLEHQFTGQVLTENSGQQQVKFTHNNNTVYGNAALLSVVIQNIIENGLKYNASEIKKVAVTASSEDDDFVLITVEDNGIGLPEGSEQTIFQPFVRLKEHNRYPGTGLGLAIVLKIVRLHNGKIEVKRLANGTRFNIRLPKRQPTLGTAPKRDSMTIPLGEYLNSRRALF